MKRDILVNHVGMVPAGDKHCVVLAPVREEFRVVNLWNGRIVSRGRLRGVGGDLGKAWTAAFGGVTPDALHEIRCGGEDSGGTDLARGPDVVTAGGQISRVLAVHPKVYSPVLRTLFNYFPSQRCGDSATGWNAPCHVRDAKKADTGEHVDVSGGWHQSCDLRKWTAGTAFGLLGLAQLKLAGNPRWNTGQIEDEIKWGNLYFHKMVRPDSGLMDHVVIPEDWTQERTLYSNDAPGTAMWTVLIGQAMAARVFAATEPAYSAACVEAARRIWNYLTGPSRPKGGYRPGIIPRFHEWAEGWHWQESPGSAVDTGGRLYAALSLFRATGEEKWLAEARAAASGLAKLQIGGDPARDPFAGCFRAAEGSSEIAGPVGNLAFGLLGLAEIAAAPAHPDSPRWRAAVENGARQMCAMSERNAWGLVPCHWYAKDPGGGRPAGSGFYRYFDERWQGRTGINMGILSAALFLMRAWKLTGERACLNAASRQVDWVLGCNPFDISTVEGVGRNQPERYVNTDEFFPPVPQIPGAVMTGITGGQDDEPVEFAMGVEAEYDMPPTSLLMWLLCELAAAD